MGRGRSGHDCAGLDGSGNDGHVRAGAGLVAGRHDRDGSECYYDPKWRLFSQDRTSLKSLKGALSYHDMRCVSRSLLRNRSR
jgi:hypothetical protein